MQKLEIELPDSLAHELQPYRDRVAEVLRLGLQQLRIAEAAAAEPVDGSVGDIDVDAEMRFKQHLLQMGVISEIRPPAPSLPPGSRKPIHVRGKPLSEMIIEERR